MKIVIQITAGRGPAECALAAAWTLREIMGEARKHHVNVEVLDRVPGSENGTIESAVIQIKGAEIERFSETWVGTIQWVFQSPYRRFHKRKNWFVGVERFSDAEGSTWDVRDVRFQTLRASGPGGQHVNKVETAVRAIHQPSGLQVMASDSRSQLQNKKAAIERLKIVVELNERQKMVGIEQKKWEQHNELQRGNPIRIFRK